MTAGIGRVITAAAFAALAGTLAACAGAPGGTGYGNRDINSVDRSGRKVRLSPRAAVSVAFKSWQRKNHGNAISLATYAIDSHRLTPRGMSLAHFVRGLAYHSTKRYDAAEIDYTASISADANNHLAYHSRAILRSIRNDHSGAADDLSASIRIRPTYTSHYIRGLVYLRLRRIGAAYRDATTVLGMRPDRYHGYYLRGLTYHLRGKHRQAASDYRRALEINPRHEGAQRALRIVNRARPGVPALPRRRPDVRMLPISATTAR